MKYITEIFLDVAPKLEAIPECSEDIQHVRNILKRGIAGCTFEEFDWQYHFVVLCSYFKMQLADDLCHRYFDSGKDISLIRNPNKKAAFTLAKDNLPKWYSGLFNHADTLEYLETLPMIGETTRCHLGRNIGIDCCKPDRHMIRLSEQHGYGQYKKVKEQWRAVTRMCTDVRDDIGNAEMIGTIDVILWWACNLRLL